MSKSQLVALFSIACLSLMSVAEAQDSQPEAPSSSEETRLSADTTMRVEEPNSLSWLAKRRRPGAYLGFGLSQPDKVGEFNHYDVIYGKKEKQFNFFAGYYLYSYLFDFGLGTNFGYYSAKGNPVASLAGQTLPLSGDLPSGVEVDRNQELELTLVPVQLLAQLAISPFASRRIVLRGWIGPEWLYVQESLKPKLPDSETPSTDTKSLANRGWNRGTVMGAMISISLTGLEARSDYSLQSLGIDRIFISPFLEIVKTNDAGMGNFDRRAYGIAFSFESLR